MLILRRKGLSKHRIRKESCHGQRLGPLWCDLMSWDSVVGTKFSAWGPEEGSLWWLRKKRGTSELQGQSVISITHMRKLELSVKVIRL